MSHVKLNFDTQEDAVAFAVKNGKKKPTLSVCLSVCSSFTELILRVSFLLYISRVEVRVYEGDLQDHSYTRYLQVRT